MYDLLKYTIPNIWGYIGLAVAGSLFVRLVIASAEGIRARIRFPGVGFGAAWKGVFLGYGYEFQQKGKRHCDELVNEKCRHGDDYGLPFIIGIIELLAYPVLIVNNLPLAIGGWMTFKIVHRMKYAPEIDRGPYNRFLVANAIILLQSYCVARFFLDP